MCRKKFKRYNEDISMYNTNKISTKRNIKIYIKK